MRPARSHSSIRCQRPRARGGCAPQGLKPIANSEWNAYYSLLAIRAKVHMDAILLAMLIIGGATAFGGVGVLVGRRLIRNHVAAFHNEVVISLFAAAGVVYAVLLGFLVVVVWEAYDDAHRNVAEEASTLVPLYRLTYGMKADEGAEMRTLIRRYAQSVITDEWPTLGT